MYNISVYVCVYICIVTHIYTLNLSIFRVKLKLIGSLKNVRDEIFDSIILPLNERS
jgi:hypothetical protein